MSQTDEGVEEIPVDEEEEEEEEEEVEEEEEEEDHWSIYDADTFVSGPFQSDNCTIPEDILKFQYPFVVTSEKEKLYWPYLGSVSRSVTTAESTST
jgi:hypothetical protein